MVAELGRHGLGSRCRIGVGDKQRYLARFRQASSCQGTTETHGLPEAKVEHHKSHRRALYAEIHTACRRANTISYFNSTLLAKKLILSTSACRRVAGWVLSLSEGCLPSGGEATRPGVGNSTFQPRARHDSLLATMRLKMCGGKRG